MAIYHARIEIRGRGPGGGRHSAHRDAAYRHGLLLRDPRTEIVHDYRAKEGVAHHSLVGWTVAAGEDLSAALQRHWDAVNAIEIRSDARTHMEIEIALPAELSADQNMTLGRDLVERFRGHLGNAWDWAAHHPAAARPDTILAPDVRNLHLHAGGTMRRWEAGRLSPDKLDITERELRRWARPLIAVVINSHLARHGHSVRVDHRRLDAQYEARNISRAAAGLPLLATPLATRHLGEARTRKVRRGELDVRASRNERIREVNRIIHSFNHRAHVAGIEIMSHRLAAAIGPSFGHSAVIDLTERFARELRRDDTPPPAAAPTVEEVAIAAPLMVPMDRSSASGPSGTGPGLAPPTPPRTIEAEECATLATPNLQSEMSPAEA